MGLALFNETIPNFIANIGEWFGKLPENLSKFLTLALEKVIDWGKNL